MHCRYCKNIKYVIIIAYTQNSVFGNGTEFKNLMKERVSNTTSGN